MRTAEQEVAAARERGDATAVRYWEAVMRVADEAPEFTPTLRNQLRVLLRPDPVPVVPAQPRRMPRRLTKPAPRGQGQDIAQPTVPVASSPRMTTAPPVGTRDAA